METMSVIRDEQGQIVRVISTVADKSVLLALLLDTVKYLHFKEVDDLEHQLASAKEWSEANV